MNEQKLLSAPDPKGDWQMGVDIADCETITVTEWFTSLGWFRRIGNGPIEFMGDNPVYAVKR